MDRRARYFIDSKPRAIELCMDVVSLVSECRAYLGQAHAAHCVNDWRRYLDSVGRVNDGLVAIRHIARDDAAYIEAAPEVDPNQIQLWQAA